MPCINHQVINLNLLLSTPYIPLFLTPFWQVSQLSGSDVPKDDEEEDRRLDGGEPGLVYTVCRIQDIPHCLTWRGVYAVDDVWLRSHAHIWGEWSGEEDEEDEEDEYFEGAVLCEVGEHWVNKNDLLPHFADCYNCVTVKEYAEHRGISMKKAQRICDGEEEGDEEGDEGEEENEDDEAL